MNGLTHASFFSGAGGTDLGLERAGWHTVSFSEIDPYASAVLAERWPGVPNVGDITALSDRWRARNAFGLSSDKRSGAAPDPAWEVEQIAAHADLWSGGFPCQDLSVAGKRAGFAGERSVLAFAFLALVERYRPRAILLENVPGLLSSNRGRDMAALLGRMAELGYGVAYRLLDAQHFGVPQRRRRVFILGLRSDPDDVDGRVAAERAAEVLSVGTRCGRHPATGHEAGEGVADGAERGVADTLSANDWKGPGHNRDGNVVAVSAPPDADGVRAPDGLAGRAHDREQLAATLNSGGNNGGFRTEPGEHLVSEPWVTSGPEMIDGSGYHRERLSTDVTPTLNGYSTPMTNSGGVSDDPLLPLGLDSHRYRCCGNGVVAPVAEWLGRRIAEALTLVEPA